MKRFYRLVLLSVLCLTMISSLVSGRGPLTESLSGNLQNESVEAFGFSRQDGSSDSSLPVSLPSAYKNKKLYPGGIPFGVKFYTDGIIVIGFSDVQHQNGKSNPAYSAGLRTKDIITKIDGKEVSRASELTQIMEQSEGRSVTVTYIRNGKEYTAHVTPEYSTAEGRFKSGLWVRDSGAGIGTVTFIDPDTLSFGGLGHGICDGDTGELIPMDRGSVLDVKINGINKGTPGAPGEIKGYFNSGKTGTLLGNTACGVYGVLSELPKELPCEAVYLGSRDELKEGDAYIWCTLDDGGPQKYSIKITEINRAATGNKCFSITVTDKALIEKTGGIVQGMSGSPIIQNGKLVGAVTHVLINDPTTGYGIFIENMLNAAQMPMARAS